MKFLFILIAELVLLSAPKAFAAESWARILSCENGAAVVDVDTSERRNLQFVLKGDRLMGDLYRAGMISPGYGQQEYIVRGQHAELRQITATETEPVSLGGVFYPQDFKKLYWDNGSNGASAIEVEVRGADLAFKLLSFTYGTSCSNYDETDGYCRGTEVIHKTYSFLKEYVLHGCSVQ